MYLRRRFDSWRDYDEKLDKVVEINLALLHLFCGEENTVHIISVKIFWNKRFVRSVNEIYHWVIKKKSKKPQNKKSHPNLALSHIGTEVPPF